MSLSRDVFLECGIDEDTRSASPKKGSVVSALVEHANMHDRTLGEHGVQDDACKHAHRPEDRSATYRLRWTLRLRQDVFKALMVKAQNQWSTNMNTKMKRMDHQRASKEN